MQNPDLDGIKHLKQLRRNIVRMVHEAKEGHIPSAFSILEILYVLYGQALRIFPNDVRNPSRDYFVLSKGHAGAALYAVLAHSGFFLESELFNYCKANSFLGGHPDSTRVPGVEFSSGSLGHGIGMAVGAAIGLRARGLTNKVVVLVGDGEMDEGAVWESFMLARSQQLSNLVVIADCNGSQNYWNDFDYVKVMASFGWNSMEVAGHDLRALSEVLVPAVRQECTMPTFIRANTQKGYGVARFIGEHGWHRRTPTESELKEIFAELQ